MPAALIDALDPAVNRLLTRTLPGVRRASGVGLGTELAQLRPYEIGDDVRHLDAAASARTGTMHVRLHVPERALSTWIVLDLSASMAFGTADRLKSDVAEGVALVFGRLGVRRAGSVAVVAFGAGPGGPGTDGRGEPIVRVLAPRGSKPGMVALARLLAGGVAPDAVGAARAGGEGTGDRVGGGHRVGGVDRAGGGGGDLAAALAQTLTVASQPGLVVIVSDFRDRSGWERPLGALRLRHSVIAVEISDPREGELPDVGRLTVVDPESGAVVRVDSTSRRLRERFAAIEAARRSGVARELRRLAIRHVELSTDRAWLRDLGSQLR